MKSFPEILRRIEKAQSFGFREASTGAKLYGHVPHVAPEAWLHAVFPPLSEPDISALEVKLNRKVPESFQGFLRLTNGLGIFSHSIAIYGKRSNYVRMGDAVWQPFCIVTANTFDKPENTQSFQFIIGSYRSDGALLSIDDRDGSVFVTKGRSKKVRNRWSDLDTMLIEEMDRLAGLYDSVGRKIVDGPSTRSIT